MTAISTPAIVVSAEQRKRARSIGITYLVLAAVCLGIFTRRPGDAGFRISETGQFTLPAQGFAWVLGIVLVALAAAQLLRGFGKLSNVVLALAAATVFMSFLAWAAAGDSFSFVGMLQDTVTRSVPITLGALGGILSERSGVINISIEGMLLAAACTSAIAASLTNLWLGTLVGALTGAGLAAVLAVMSIRYKVDQVIVGFAINFFALGVTSFISFRVLVPNRDTMNNLMPVKPLSLPLLSDIPFFGQILFVQTIFVYFSFVAVALATWGLYRTKWGLRTRAIGEYPKAAGTLGVDVNKLRYRNLLLAGAVTGIGGAWWPIGIVGRFDQNITGGRGFIALAAVIFGRWHPVGALSGAMVFALAEAVRLKIGNFKTGIPSEFLIMAPYVVTLIVVAGFIGASRAPKAAGQPYEDQ
ncbi:MAG: ABC transporter permease [Actinomycetota bacterium]|nr:ABC transporter permease [Actinomycetota bacterium]